MILNKNLWQVTLLDIRFYQNDDNPNLALDCLLKNFLARGP